MTDQVAVFDTTLRDGEQAAGSRLGAREKLEVARQLARLRVDVIEAGFPASSPEDYDAVRLISQEIDGPTTCGLTRAIPKDIDVCGEALAGARRARIHTGIGVSDVHISGKFGNAKYGDTPSEKRDRILQMSVDAVRRARGFVDDVEFYAEDSGRAERGYLYEVVQAVIEAGATVVNIPDTTGYTVPSQFGALIRDIRAHVPNIDDAAISVHCHNDLGMAVSNTLSAVENGARQVEGTINGVGERAGNAAIEEIVMALRTRKDVFGVDTGIEARELYRTSRLVADVLGVAVPPNKAVVGSNAFAHSSGIHVDGVLKQRETYEIMKPEDVGFPESRIVLTARTGRHGVRHRLAEIGYDLSEMELEQVYARFLAVADRKQEVFDEDLVAILHDEIRGVPATYQLEYHHITSGSGTIPTATVELRIGDDVRKGAACGDGPVDAMYKAITSVTGVEVVLSQYEIRAVTSGTEAMGEVTVRLAQGGKQGLGRGASTDVIEASAKAYLDGLNGLVASSRDDGPRSPG